MLFHLFQHAARDASRAPNVFRYVSTRIGLATLTSLLITFIVAPWFIRRARERQLGELIRDDGPAGHAKKKGHADDGRLADHLGAGRRARCCGATCAARWCGWRCWSPSATAPSASSTTTSSCRARTRRGCRARSSCWASSSSALVAMIWLYSGDALPPESRLRLALPLRELPPHVGHASRGPRCRWPPTSASRVFVLMAESNAVNLTDGLDGLAIGPVIICSFTFLLLAYAAGTTLRSFNIAEYLGMPHVPGAGELAVFCGAMGGAGIGFLWFNTHPAQVFMGDVGALALGGAHRLRGAGDQDRAGAAHHRRRVRRRGGQRHHPGRLLQEDQEAHLPDGADPPPLREAGLARVAESWCVSGSSRSPARF